MRHLHLLLVAGTLALGGCTSLETIINDATNTTVSPQVAQVLVQSYGIAEGVGTAYIASCHKLAGTAQACNRSTEQKVFSDLRIYGQDRDAVLKLLRTNNGGSIPVVNYNTLMTSYDALKADLVGAGLNVGS
jgi:hypothetical protein